MLSSVEEEPYLYELIENILHGSSSQIISEASQTPIKAFIQYFEQQKNIFSDILLPRLGTNLSIALKKNDCISK